MKFKINDIVIYLNNDYDDGVFDFKQNSVTKLTRLKDAGGHYWIQGNDNSYELCVDKRDIRKVTLEEIVKAKLLGNYYAD